ncbi:HAD family hydrolase [Halomonas aquamarina]|uniref:HAD family hydrolase n=1 Tax=Vreelandella aquamarina TaxID=77097 RepID=A0ACC5VR98_9GAMM|nr:HAD family hydrolase [Halomonas aquamarina]MBZ5486449.1 HAD family hydrolase [Halomonas aquamarina]
MKHALSDYKTLVFDCDGVVLNSNRVKTNAFYKAALPYGEAAAEALVEYHVRHGGISRYRKFAHFLESIVKPEQSGPTLEELLKRYADNVCDGLMSCKISPDLERLKEATASSRWLIVSGGDQTELRRVFTARGIDHFFDGGIFGSPNSKDEILNRELTTGNIQQPALFLGDSKYDYQASSAAGLDFVFLTGWTEMVNYDTWVSNENLTSAINLGVFTDLYS